MATISPFTTCSPKYLSFKANNSFSLSPRNPILHFQPNTSKPLHSSFQKLNKLKKDNFFSLKTTLVKSSEEENPVTEEGQQQQGVVEGTAEQQTVSVPVSPSDTLTMHFPYREHGVWEDPDDGSDSENDEEADSDREENDLEFESDWEQEVVSGKIRVNTATTVNYEDDLVKAKLEAEQLLEPEERAILQQNVTPNLDKISTEKWNPLHSLGLAAQIPLMDKLLENGLDIDTADKDGLTALHKAIIGKKEAVISHLLRKGANPHARDLDGATMLHYAVQVGALQTVKLLIKYKVDVNVADNEGWTPLHIAMQSRNRNIGKILLVNGADKTRRSKDGKTPLDISLCYGKDFKSYDLAKLLKLVPANREL